MPAPYIPGQDAQLLNWALNFDTLIVASPPTYGLVTADGSAISTVVNAYSDAYSTCINPSTRTPMSVQAKNTAKASMLPVVRSYAQQIANNAGVTSDNKIALGLNPRTATPTPIPAPSTSPQLNLIAATPLQITLRYTDQNAPATSRAKPFGATGLQLYVKVSDTPITDPALLTFYGTQTKQPVAVNFNSADVGKQAYMAARWVTLRGLVGPWSLVKHMTVSGS